MASNIFLPQSFGSHNSQLGTSWSSCASLVWTSHKDPKEAWCFLFPRMPGGNKQGGHGIHSRKLTAVPWKLMVGSDVFSYWNSPFLVDMDSFPGCIYIYQYPYLDPGSSPNLRWWGWLGCFFFTENSGCFRKEGLFPGPPPKKQQQIFIRVFH